MINAAELKRLVDRHAMYGVEASERDLSDFLLSHASELLALVEANVARRRKALDDLIAMDADLYDDPPPEPAQWHAIVIGDFKLCCEGRAPGKVWIETEGGEGGDFPIADIAALIREYYDANF